MTPSVRSRLWASATSFALGFGIGNYGVLMIARPDQWLWIAVAVVLMTSPACGVAAAALGLAAMQRAASAADAAMAATFRQCRRIPAGRDR